MKKEYDFVSSIINDGFASVELNGKWGMIDETGKEVIECKYNNVDDFHNGFARVVLNGKWGIIDETGKVVVECKYDYIGLFNDGFARVELNDKWGYIDETGKEVIECKYDYIYYANRNGFFHVQLNGEEFWINQGETIKIKINQTKL